MHQDSFKNVLDEPLTHRINEVAQTLNESEDFHSPIAWRNAIPQLAAIDLPVRFGGSPLTTMQMMSVFRTFGRLSLDLRDVPGLGHGRMLTLPADSDSFAPFVHRIANAKSFLAICVTEESAGTDLHALQTTAVRVPGGYELTGAKSFVARLRQADIFIIFARHPEWKQGLTAFLVETNARGISIRDIASLGLKGISWGAVTLDRVFVPDAQRIGEEGQAFALFSQHFTYWRCAMAAAATGAAEVAMEKAKERLHRRTAFWAPIGRFSHLQQQYAIHASRLHMAWLLINEAASRIDGGHDSYVDAAMAKAEAVEICLEAVQWSMQVHGAHGYSVVAGLEKTLRDLLGLRIADGTTDVLRGQVARGLLSEELYARSIGRPVKRSQTIERNLW
ncbi:hypothetical protein PI87_19740 [Ralstonia sp. A12]|uniref:acyl-CoA dehydrogenase family protein n=1 Tax=Ralstonia sp. A12 TaxID=1217052 RepID=UPI000573D5C9|nr:acyl-CoA dehydrogenase family protein [Ralstonia sp. A12]KHK52068.1 hypothetical protein PI87_19740 [Ralstonia sp. A12]